MVDENNIKNITLDNAIKRSDSSMVDENKTHRKIFGLAFSVQIPLWSMKTEISSLTWRDIYRFRFLYGRWKRRGGEINAQKVSRSDSSMVDENGVNLAWFWAFNAVQIPLWSMKTFYGQFLNEKLKRFRFLYGRWNGLSLTLLQLGVQILWSMKTEIQSTERF